jgi:hypothetical protein
MSASLGTAAFDARSAESEISGTSFQGADYN